MFELYDNFVVHKNKEVQQIVNTLRDHLIHIVPTPEYTL